MSGTRRKPPMMGVLAASDKNLTLKRGIDANMTVLTDNSGDELGSTRQLWEKASRLRFPG